MRLTRATDSRRKVKKEEILPRRAVHHIQYSSSYSIDPLVDDREMAFMTHTVPSSDGIACVLGLWLCKFGLSMPVPGKSRCEAAASLKPIDFNGVSSPDRF